MHDHVPSVLACLATPALHSRLVSCGTPHSSRTGFRVRHRLSVFHMTATILHVLHRCTLSCSCTRAQPLLQPHLQRPALPPRDALAFSFAFRACGSAYERPTHTARSFMSIISSHLQHRGEKRQKVDAFSSTSARADHRRRPPGRLTRDRTRPNLQRSPASRRAQTFVRQHYQLAASIPSPSSSSSSLRACRDARMRRRLRRRATASPSPAPPSPPSPPSPSALAPSPTSPQPYPCSIDWYRNTCITAAHRA